MLRRIEASWITARARLERIPRRWAVAPCLGIAVAVSAMTFVYWPQLWPERGTDYGFYVEQAERWFRGDGFYEARQLAGSYEWKVDFDNTYPPPALWLFLPFVWLPGPIWWAVPLTAIVAVVLWLRPAPWAWPLIAIACLPPRTQAIVLWGNTTMWITAFVALGLLYAWPAVLIHIKPYFAPLILIGARHRSWWLALAIVVLGNLPLLPMWVEFLTAWRNAGRSWPSIGYAPDDVFILSIPIVAWLARRRSPQDDRVVEGRWRRDRLPPNGVDTDLEGAGRRA